MTIDINKKHIVIGAIAVLLIVVGMFVGNAIKNSSYMKNAKQCQFDIHQLYYMSSLLSSEVHDAWRGYIIDDKHCFNKSNGKFYKNSWNMPEGSEPEWCSGFSDAVSKITDYYEERGVVSSLDSLYSCVKQRMTKITPAPQKYSDIQSDINVLFHTAEGMYNCATSPEGNLTSYTSSINTLSADYKKNASQVDIEIGEIDKEKLADAELEILLRFL